MRESPYSLRLLRLATDRGLAGVPPSVVDQFRALIDVAEAARDFLSSEYPHGTDHPADAEANRLAQRVARFES